MHNLFYFCRYDQKQSVWNHFILQRWTIFQFNFEKFRKFFANFLKNIFDKMEKIFCTFLDAEIFFFERIQIIKITLNLKREI